MPHLKKEKKAEEPKVPFLVYLKAFFLLFVVVFGMFILSRVTESKKQAQKKSEPSYILSTSKKFISSLSKDKIQKGIQEEIRTNEVYKNAVSRLDESTDTVLGEASKAASAVVEESKEALTDQLYEYTYGKIVENMVKTLPARQKELLLQRMCK